MVGFKWAQTSIDGVNEVVKCETGEEIEMIFVLIVMAADWEEAGKEGKKETTLFSGAWRDDLLGSPID